MATLNFLGSKLQSFKDDGSVNASGTVEFFAVGGAFSTYVSSYTSSSFATANSNTVTLDAAGRADCWLNSDADVRVRDSAGTTIDTQLNINPDSSSSVVTDNLPANASFEDDASADLVPDGWAVTEYTGGTVEVDTADRSHGKNSLKFISVGNGGGTATTDDFVPVTAGGQLQWGFDLKSTADVRNLVQILWYDAAQVALGSPTSDLYDNSTTNPTSWTKKQGYVAVPATAYFAKFRIFGAHSSDATSGTVRFDNIELRDATKALEGPAVASAATTSIFDGFFSKHITGTTTITSFGTANFAGERVRVVFDDALTLTHAANLRLPGAANITTAEGDWAYVYADTTSQFDVEFHKVSGQPVVEPSVAGTGSEMFTANGTWTRPAGVAYVYLTGCAGGGGGGDSNAGTGYGGGGGGSGAWCFRKRVAVAGNVTVTIGAAGAASAGSGSGEGGAGGDTIFGAVLTLGGGQGGHDGAANDGAGGAAGSAGGGNAGKAGGNSGTSGGFAGGGASVLFAGANGSGAASGAGGIEFFVFPAGASGLAPTAVGNAPAQGGAGGSGGAGSNSAGGAGGAGFLLVEW